MELKTEGIVLKRYRKGENDDITVIFTRDAGKILAASVSTRKPSSKLKITLDPFSLNTYSLLKKNENSGYFRLIQSAPVKMYQEMRKDLKKIGYFYLVAELVDKFLGVEDKNEDVFCMVKELFSLVDSGKYHDIGLLEGYFKVRLLKFAGFTISDNAVYMSKARVGSVIKTAMKEIEKEDDVLRFSIEKETIKEMNEFIDFYIISILGEEIRSSKFIEMARER